MVERSLAARERREHECDDTDQEPKPNPCRPEAGSDPCDCARPPVSSRPKRPRRPKPRGEGCCEQLIDLLLRGEKPGRDTLRKPKQKPARKALTICETIGIPDAVLPVLALLWNRFEADEAPRTDFETFIAKLFAGFEKQQRAALKDGFGRLAAFRKEGKGECLFNDCLSDHGRREGIEGRWVVEEMLREGLGLAGQVFLEGSGGVMGPGQTRLWDNAVHHGPNGSGVTLYNGPWPWLTAIRPDFSSYREYGNTISYRPAPGASHVWESYQFAQSCSFTAKSGGGVQSSCSRVHPAPPPPGGIAPNDCEGGQGYNVNNDCLAIPAVRPGASIVLRGFNFITEKVKVRFTHRASGLRFEVEAQTWGDLETPAKDETEHYIVDERVRDWVDVQLPSGHPTVPQAPLPVGLYSVQVIVPNVTNALYDSAVSPVLESNALALRVEPSADTAFRLWSDSGRCIEETPGWGSDEIWFDGFVAHIVPQSIPLEPSSTPPPAADVATDHKVFPRDPWDDMDSGENAGGFSIDLFGPKSIELYGVVAIAILGFEVDSEAAAREQIKNFGEAYWYALKEVASYALSAEGAAGSIIKAIGATVSQVLIAVAIIAVVVLIAIAFWAAWAGPDLIALDMFAFDATQGWNKTDAALALDPPDELAIGEVDVTHTPVRKIGNPGEAQATYFAEHRYRTPEGEDSDYVLGFKLARL